MPKPVRFKKLRKRTIVASADDPTRREMLRAAGAYVASEVSVIPIQPGGEKRPAWELLPRIGSEHDDREHSSWKPYQDRLPTVAELNDWFRGAHDIDPGMAAIAGAVSGNLEILDLDSFDVVEPWRQAVEAQIPGLVDRLVRVITPRPGMHVYYRCKTIGGSEKLARVPELDPKTAKLKPKVIAETKGEGGYCLCPPSPADCHARNVCYRFEGDKDLTMIPTIRAKERDVLLNAARELNTWKEPVRGSKKRLHHGRRRGLIGGRPGDAFNAIATWEKILTPHGWFFERQNEDGSEHWRRPGKNFGTSATVNYQGSDLLYVFSSNADPFDELTGYTKFSAYALLEHGGDYPAAASELARLGYGSGHSSMYGRRTRRSTSTDAPYAGIKLRSRTRRQ
jgi:putative DNA primase/helicase